MMSIFVNEITESELLNSVLQNAKLWQEFHSLEGELLYISPYCETVSGYRSEEFQKDEALLINITYDEDQENLERFYFEKNSPEETEIIFRIRHRSGDTLWIKASKHSISLNDPPYSGIYICYQDISHIKRLEDVFDKNQKIIQSLLDFPYIILVITNIEGKIIHISDIIAKRSGISKASIIGKSLWEIFDPDVTAYRKQWFEKVIISKKPLRVEDFRTLGDKPREIYDNIIFPILDHAGEVSQILSISRDISLQNQAKKDLSKSKRQLETALDNITDGIFVLDGNGNLIYANPTAKIQFLFSFEEFISAPKDLFHRFNFRNENGDPIPWENLPSWKALIGEQPAPTIIRYKTNPFQEDNWLIIKATPVFDDKNRVEMVIIITTDITDNKHTQREVEKAHNELEKRTVIRTAELSKAIQNLKNEITVRKEAEQQARESASHAQALVRVAQRLSAQLDLKTLLNTICKEAAKVPLSMRVKICSVFLYDEKQDSLINSAYHIVFGEPPDFFPTFPREIFDTWLQYYGSIILVPNTRDWKWLDEINLPKQYPFSSYLCVSMWHEGKLIGFLDMLSEQENDLPTENEIALIQAITNQATIAIVKARLLEEVTAARNHLQLLSQKLVQVQEDERVYLARELHDELGGLLTSLHINLDLVAQTQSSKQIRPLIQAQELTEKLTHQVRKLSLDLRPAILDDLGLLPALLSYFEQYQEQTNIYVDFKHNKIRRRFPPLIETTAYRAIQEALTNTARHANINHVAVRVWMKKDYLNIQIKDEGIGFDTTQKELAFRTFGLSGMQERVKMVQGNLEIESSQGEGTCINIDLPISGHHGILEQND